MRIWLKPDRMAQLGLTTSDIANAVSKQNQQFAVGRIGDSPTPYPVKQTFPVTTSGAFTEPSQFENIILRAENQAASIVRLKDVGHADLGRKSYALRTDYQGKPATLIAVYQQPGANAIEVSKQVRGTLAELSKSFPEGLDYDVALDTTRFVQASINEVINTFFEAVVLVVLVVFIFLHSLRLDHHPDAGGAGVASSAPSSACWLFGFSINMLTLFGMILAIGIVVDDAIVVVENTERNMVQYGLSPADAAKRAMDEVTGPVIAIVLVLNARCSCRWLSWAASPATLQAVRRHHRHLGGVLGLGRAHPVARRWRRSCIQAKHGGEEGLLQVVRRRLRAH